MANRHRDPAKEQHWRQLLHRWQTSGQSVHAFCRTHGLSRPLFYAWRGILAERDAAAAAPRSNVPTPAAASPAFVPIHVRADGPAEVIPPEEACLEVLLSGQRVLRIRPGFDAATLQRLLAVLEPPEC
jgi:transposase